MEQAFCAEFEEVFSAKHLLTDDPDVVELKIPLQTVEEFVKKHESLISTCTKNSPDTINKAFESDEQKRLHLYCLAYVTYQNAKVVCC